MGARKTPEQEEHSKLKTTAEPDRSHWILAKTHPDR